MKIKIKLHLFRSPVTLTFMLLFALTPAGLFAQPGINLATDFNDNTTGFGQTGRGLIQVRQGVLSAKDAWASFGQSGWRDYEVSFKARTPENEDQVQIWAAFRASTRDDRYILGLRGGIQNDLYLARLGYMGTDDHLALRHLDFDLRKGQWYTVRVQVAGDRIRVFLNDETLPRIDVRDENSRLSPEGKVLLGGSWITTEFDDLKITGLNAADLSPGRVPLLEYRQASVDKEELRKKERASYKPLTAANTVNPRSVISLNGKWLFSPGYDIKNAHEAIDPSVNDEAWHVLTVPVFWNPTREWLHGERYNTESKGVSDNYYQKEIERCEAYTFDYKKTNVGWYRQWIELPSDIKNRHLELDFDAVSKVAEVYINGKKAGDHIGMFGEFRIDATGLLKPGRNLVTVKVLRDYVTDIKDADKVTDIAVTVPVTNKMLKDLAHGFYDDDPAGIWQPVSLIITDPVRIEDVFIKPGLAGAAFEVTVKNHSGKQALFSISAQVISTDTKDKIYDNIPVKRVQLKAGEERVIKYSVSGLNPQLWTPETPNLYNFSFALQSSGNEIDRKTIESGFRTFEARGDYFYLNGRKYWLRGGNHTPMSLAPNDTLLANRFCELMHDGNIMVTRTHTAPYDELWMTASDRKGVGVSYEGQWPWLMITSSMPDQNLIDLWKAEYFDLLKKYRNHPSLLFWTVNNEMKFYDNDPDFERTKLKMKIISDVVKKMREIDPTRPVCFDSNYRRNEKKFGKDFFKTIDDGDIDDQHWYVNWYHGSIFSEFKGEFQQKFKNPGRPLISQEMSTGYPGETGHPTRFYSYVHQTPQTLVGNYSYEFADPSYFLKTHEFITKELAEALRRTNDQAAGILHFALLTWFKDIYKADKITPHPTYYGMKQALQPVLVSAELWGRHFYAGEKLPVRFCIVNDNTDGAALPQTELHWSVIGEQGDTILAGTQPVPVVPYYGRQWIEPSVMLPETLAAAKLNGKLVLKLLENGKPVSENDYDLLLADRNWLQSGRLKGRKITVVDLPGQVLPALDYAGIIYQKAGNILAAIKQKPDILLLNGLNQENAPADQQIQIRSFVKKGGKVLLLNSADIAPSLYPQQIRSVLKDDGEIISMEIPESSVFDGIEPLDTRYFNNNQRENPFVCTASFRVNRGADIQSLASYSEVHGYLEGRISQRQDKLDQIKGYPIVKISDQGQIILSGVMLQKGTTDPVAGKLLVNMLNNLLND